MIEDLGESFLSESNLVFFVRHFGSNQGLLVHVWYSFLVVVFIKATHNSELTLGLRSTNHRKSFTVCVEQLLTIFAILDKGQDDDHCLENKSLNRKNEKLVAPLDLDKDDDVGDVDEYIAEEEAEEGCEAQDPVVAVGLSEARHRAFEAVEARIEHLSTLEVEEEDEDRKPSLSLREEVEPFYEDLVFLADLLSVVENKDDVGD